MDFRNRTPAHYCAEPVSPWGIKYLYEDVPQTFKVRDADGHTPEDVAGTISIQQEEEFKVAKTAPDVSSDVCQGLEQDVGTFLVCTEEGVPLAPAGYAFVSSEESDLCDTSRGGLLGTICAVKCPNHDACPGQPSPWVASCREEYADVGCARCAETFGRSSHDPFVCQKCGRLWEQWSVFLGKQLEMYSLSLYTANKAKHGYSRHSSLLKIALSFGTPAVSMKPAVQSSAAIQNLLPKAGIPPLGRQLHLHPSSSSGRVVRS